MPVDRYKIHDIEVVVDRLKVEDEFKVRISQSVQQTLKMGKDLMFLLVNEADRVIQYSRQLMCEDTSISYEEPSPNSFSFNSPYGACPTCKGLGQVYTIDMNAIMPDDSLSINEGGIAPLGAEREAYVFRQVQTLSRKNKFSLDKPLKDLPEKALNLVLYGKENGLTGEELQFNDEEIEGNVYSGEFEGVV